MKTIFSKTHWFNWPSKAHPLARVAISRIELTEVHQLILVNQIRFFALYKLGDDSDLAHRLRHMFLNLKRFFAPARTPRAPAQG